MPAAKPVRHPPALALEEGLVALFRRLQSEPAPAALIALADQLEAAWAQTRVAAEARAIG
jgi:hypothetical protein